MRPDLSIIIVNWNTEEFLKKLLESINRHISGITLEIIVVDNASQDASVKTLETDFPKVKLIRNKRNEGFAKANNMGIRASGGRHILLLNPDTLLTDGSLIKMLQFMDNNPSAGVAGCKLILPGGFSEAGAAGYLPSLATAFNYHFFLSAVFPRIFRGLYINQASYKGKPVPVGWVSGACMMIKREVADAGISLNEGFFMYAEDMELCERITRAGWNVYYMPDSQVIHFRGRSLRQADGAAQGMHLDSLARHFRASRGKGAAKVFLFYHICGFSLRMALYKALYRIKGDKFYLGKAQELKRYFTAGLRLLAYDD